MNESLHYAWDVLLPRVCGITHWSVLKKCYHNISTGRPNPTASNPHAEPFIQASSEALLLWMFENSWERWMLRAKFSISNPDLTKYKDEDGNFLKGLEKMQGKCTSSCAGRQPFGGITAVGIDRLTHLTKEIERNGKENSEFIKLVEDDVRAMVHARNGQQQFDDNKKMGRKKKAPVMMLGTEPEDSVDVDND